FQTIGASRFGLFLSTIRQGIFYIPCIILLPRILGINGIYFSQPIADVLTIIVCLLSYKAMKRIATQNMNGV
ncbi:MAG: MATE family efflux transporter, partial [Oscillospiraceae bacterium]